MSINNDADKLTVRKPKNSVTLEAAKSFYDNDKIANTKVGVKTKYMSFDKQNGMVFGNSSTLIANSKKKLLLCNGRSLSPHNSSLIVKESVKKKLTRKIMLERNKKTNLDNLLNISAVGDETKKEIIHGDYSFLKNAECLKLTDLKIDREDNFMSTTEPETKINQL